MGLLDTLEIEGLGESLSAGQIPVDLPLLSLLCAVEPLTASPLFAHAESDSELHQTRSDRSRLNDWFLGSECDTKIALPHSPCLCSRRCKNNFGSIEANLCQYGRPNVPKSVSEVFFCLTTLDVGVVCGESPHLCPVCDSHPARPGQSQG